MAHMDVFRANLNGAFSQLNLTAVLLDQPHVPMRLGQMGLFQSDGVTTTRVSIEQQGNTLDLVETTPRATPAVINGRDERKLIEVPTARIALDSPISADEIQNVRALGSESELMTLQEVVNRRNIKASNRIEATLEFQRIGALRGLVLDKNGDTLVDLFATFGVVAQTEFAFDLQAASPTPGVLRNRHNAVIRLIEDELGGLPYEDIHGMASSQFFDALTAHAEYREQYLASAGAQQLGERTARRFALFGGITWEEYRGKVGNQKYVEDNKAHIFPVGVPDLFITRYAPAEWFNFVNTVGLPRYSRLMFDPNEPDSRVIARVQTQTLNICTRPRVLIPARLGA